MKWFLVVLTFVFVFGCTKVTDEQAIEDTIATDLKDYFDADDNYGKPEGDTIADKSIGKGYLYVIWWRELKNFSRNINVTIENDSAFVEVDISHSGILHRFPFNTIPPDTLYDIPKNFADNGKRYAIFKKIGDPSINNGWILTDITYKKIVSNNEPPFKIDSVKFEKIDTSESWVVKDPLQFIKRDSLVKLPKGTKLNVYVFTSPPTESVVVFMHVMANQRHHRYRIRQNTNGTFFGYCWTTPRSGVYRFGIDAMTYGTIFEDDTTLYPYEAEAWIIPYVSE